MGILKFSRTRYVYQELVEKSVETSAFPPAKHVVFVWKWTSYYVLRIIIKMMILIHTAILRTWFLFCILNVNQYHLLLQI